MLTSLNWQESREKASVLSTAEEMRGSLQDQALIAHGKAEDAASSFRKTRIKKAESICLMDGSCYEELTCLVVGTQFIPWKQEEKMVN